MKFLKRTALVLFGLILLIGLGLWGWFYTKKPKTSGELTLDGLSAKVEVLYDDYGVPHIYAQNEADLYMAFGYVHAQDRLFQMELVRRLGDGRLAEIFGKDALPVDKFFRTLSFREHAKLTIDSVYKTNPDAPFVKAAYAYLRGVNAYQKNGTTPVEFQLLGIEKSDFTIEDIEIISGYMGYSFSEAFRTEAVCTFVKEHLGDAYFNEFYTPWPEGGPKIPTQATETAKTNGKAQLLALGKFTQTIDSQLPMPAYEGSNGWCVAGNKSKSGKPILSNDTHIGYAQPSVWYEAHLVCPGMNLYGNFLAGTPTAALGHNENGGWGITMFENDDADFYRETPDSTQPNAVMYKGKSEALTLRQEIIKIKDQPTDTLLVRKSRHGYIMSDVLLGNSMGMTFQNETKPLAVWATFYQFPNRSIETFYRLGKASTAADAQAAVALVHAPGLNFMWADRSGNIAWWAAAKLVKRPPNVNPVLVLDGESGKDDPIGWYDFSHNPQIINPKRGILYTANNQPDDMGDGLIPGYYVPVNRAKRIESLLFNDKKDWDEASLRTIINDVTTPEYPALYKALAQKFKPQTEASQQAAATLLAWDGSHPLNATAPTIFYRFLFRLREGMTKDELGSFYDLLGHQMAFERSRNRLFTNENSVWWDDTSTPNKRETQSEILSKAFETAVADLTKQLGNNQKDWLWERVHFLHHKHPLAAGGWAFEKLFSVGPIAAPGGQETINNISFGIDSTGYYMASFGPALRRIVDFGDPTHGRSVLPTGQSGVVSSPHYANQAGLYASGGSRPELMHRPDIEAASNGKKLVFSPK